MELKMAVNFIFSKDIDEERVMHSKTGNMEIMFHYKGNIIKYQIWLETSIKGSDSIFDHIKLFYHRCHKTNLNLDGPYVGSPDWIKSKKGTVNKNDNQCCHNRIAS